ncbi:MAG TPA: T9SS type A sorting domain-containing protein [Chitinophagales bacterium]|nr:T9SS type A sorting domain-containing protein [Chitinophagales bacterium]
MTTSKPGNLLTLRSLFFAIIFFTFFFLTKVASCQTYNTVDWGTYFNDNAHFPDFNYQLDDDVNDMAVTKTSPESIYVIGKTSAATLSSLPVCSGNQTIDLHDVNGFLTKYNSCGELVWSTYIGSNAFCVALDIENGKTIIYVGGKANSGNSFSCDGSAAPVFQDQSADATNGFIAKYEDNDTSVSLLRWTYLSGTATDSVLGTDAVYSIAVYQHHLFFCGETFSGNIYFGAQYKGDTTYAGKGDAYIAEFDSLLSNLIFFTYIGGSDWDRCHDIKVYQSGSSPINIFAGGSTLSGDGIAKAPGFDLTYNGDNDTYVTKWKGSSVNGPFTKAWSTYVGGSGMEHGRRLAVDDKGNVFFTGWTESTDFPVTSLAYDTAGSGNNSFLDAFVIKISNKGVKQWCTYFGGNSKEEVGRSLLVFKKNGTQYVVFAGLTKSVSSNFPLVNPLQNLLNGNDSQQYYDEFIAILTDVTSTQQQLVFSTYLGGSNEEHIGVGQYHPIIAFGPHKEIYITSPSKSADIQQVVGNEFQDIVHGYNGGGPDVFTAKLINIDNLNQSNCPILKFSNPTNDEFNQLHIFPNPFQQIFTAEINSESDGKSLIEVTDAYGKLILKEEILIRSGVNQIPVDLKNSSCGIYFIRITDKDKVIFTGALKQ